MALDMSSTARTRRASVLHTATFRLAAVFSIMFGAGAALLLLVLDLGISRFAELEMEQALTHQMEVMRADANLEGGEALASILDEQIRTSTLQRYAYRIVSADGRTLISGLPSEVQHINGYGLMAASESPSPDRPASPGSQIMVLTSYANDGTFLAVGRDNFPLQALRTHLHRLALWGGVGLLVLAMLAGLIVGALFLRRLDQVNRAAERIMAGQPSERLPAIGFGREFELLAANLNRMLDRQEATMNTLRQISADVAHDLRTPLNRLRNLLEEAEGEAPEQQTASIRTALTETDEILSIITALLAVARIEGGNVNLAFRPVAADELVQTLAGLYLPAAEEGGHALRVALSGGATFSGDPVLLTQMLSNLLDNALLHTPEGTVVEVAAERGQDSVSIIVCDNGPGVPDEERDAILRRFYRLDRSRNTPGVGLGLPLASAIADLHGAAFLISDNAPGLRVEVRFPVPAPAWAATPG